MHITRNLDLKRFETTMDGQTAYAEYQMAGGQMIVTHIIVPPAIEGQGVGSALAKFAIEVARDEELTIVPQCPFMAAYFERHPEYNDALAGQS